MYAILFDVGDESVYHFMALRNGDTFQIVIEELQADGIAISQLAAELVDEHSFATTEVEYLDLAAVFFLQVRYYLAI